MESCKFQSLFSAVDLSYWLYSLLSRAVIQMDSQCCFLKCFLNRVQNPYIILSLVWGFGSLILKSIWKLLLNPEIFLLFLITISIDLILVERAMLDQMEYVPLVFDRCLLIVFCFFVLKWICFFLIFCRVK